MKTKKTRRELEEERGYKFVAWILLLLFISSSVFMFVYFFKTQDLRTQLSECQEQVDVWELEVKCEYDSSINYYGVETRGINVTEEQFLYLEFSLYEDYQDMIDEIKQDENCEVIE